MKAEFIRDICLGFQEATEEIKWGHDLCFLVRDKMFCITSIEGDFGVSIKVNVDQQEELLGREGIFPAPYLARYNWIHVKNINAFTHEEWNCYLRQSYELILKKATGKKRGKISVKFA